MNTPPLPHQADIIAYCPACNVEVAPHPLSRRVLLVDVSLMNITRPITLQRLSAGQQANFGHV